MGAALGAEALKDTALPASWRSPAGACAGSEGAAGASSLGRLYCPLIILPQKEDLADGLDDASPGAEASPELSSEGLAAPGLRRRM